MRDVGYVKHATQFSVCDTFPHCGTNFSEALMPNTLKKGSMWCVEGCSSGRRKDILSKIYAQIRKNKQQIKHYLSEEVLQLGKSAPGFDEIWRRVKDLNVPAKIRRIH